MEKLRNNFKNSCNGLKLAWADDQSFRNSCWQFIIGAIIASAIVIYNDFSAFLWLLLVGSLFPIVIVETINCSIEAVTDKASPERHPLAKKAKDIGSAAVFMTRMLALCCWLTVFLAYKID
jgi:diacylglycerol kinase (ATP)